MKFRKFLLFIFLFFPPAISWSSNELGVIDSYPAGQVEKLKSGNERFVRRDSKRKQLIGEQKPLAIVLSCSDSRVSPEIIFDQGLGDLFVVRVAGNVLNSENIASVEYAVKKLDVHLILVMGHDYCGAIQAAMNSSKSASESNHYERLLTSIRKNILKGGGSLDPSLSGNNYHREAMANAKGVIRLLFKESSFIESQFERKKTLIFPAVYSLESGRVEFGKVD